MKTFWKIVFGSLLGCLIASVLGFILLISLVGSLGASLETATSKVPVAAQSVLRIDANSVVSERGAENFSIQALQGGMGSPVSLYDAVRGIDAAATDPRIKFIYLQTDDMVVSVSQAEELRTALSRFRESGKPVIAYANNHSMLTYYLASVADKVLMNTYGEAYIIGLGTRSLFLKDLLDKVGVEVQLIRHGKYKSAGEMFISNHISEANKQQTQAMVDGLWSSMADEICSSRGFSREELDSWISGLEFEDAQSLLDKNLIDTVYHTDEISDYLCNLAGASDFEKIHFTALADYAKSLVSTGKAKEKIAILYADGEIVTEGDPERDIVGTELAAEIAKVRKDSTIKAVVFRVNSPGGSVQASEVIRHEIELLQAAKPVVASYGDYAASGGYWISSGVNKIFTDNTTLTGSIGVFSMIPNFGGVVSDKLHVGVDFTTSHDHSDMMSGLRKLDGEEVEYMQESVEKIYDKFVGLVADGRGMPAEKVDEIAQGRVWCGCDALGIGLVDEKGGLCDAVSYAASMVGLQNYKVEVFPKVKTTMERLMEMFSSTESVKAFFAEKEPVSAWNQTLMQLEDTYEYLKTSSDAQMMARMPYIYEIR
ncbi:MAG: signal peptide peptidase SppA [Bacteroidales bacterium]|nr:signal peptide peptidase SppA [Candidatus Equibacterium intestinale]